MPGLYTEADYENSVIELFRNELGYEYAYGPDIERTFTVLCMRRFFLTPCII